MRFRILGSANLDEFGTSAHLQQMVCDNSWLADVDLGMVQTCLKVREVRICDRRCSGTGIEDGLFWGSKTATITIPAAITTGSQARLFRLLRFLKGLCCWLIEPPVRWESQCTLQMYTNGYGHGAQSP